MKHPSRGQKILFDFASKACVVCAAVLLPLTLFAQPATRQNIHVRLPAAARSAQPVSRMAATEQLNLAIGLPLRNQAALNDLLRQIYDPSSTNYHHYLTPAQFTERFGPTQADYLKLKTFARANHLRIATEHPNRVLLEVSGSVADIEQVFHTTLRVYHHPTESRTFYAPDTEPSLDLSVPVVSIGGLNNYALPRPRLKATPLTTGKNALPNSGSGPSGSYLGLDFRAAYAPDTSLTGAGQVVGLLQFDGYTADDITNYEAQAGLPNVPLENVLLNGATGLPSGSGGEVEVSLDIQMAISMAPGLDKVILYIAPNPSPFEVILNRMVTDNEAKQLSCSWFIPGGGANGVTDGIFQQMAAQGQSFFNASGDFDAFSGLIDFPGDTPYITQVGGTILTTATPGGPRVSETAWNRNNGVGTGGGISTQYSIPVWQTNINMAGNQGSTTLRNVPDVAMVAESIYVRVNGTDHTVGGTSASAPLWAGFNALINQQADMVGNPPVGFLNPLLSQLAVGTNYSLLHDVTTGNNTNSGSPNRFFAVPGYDLCTGWGTPIGQDLINALEPLITVSLLSSATEGDGLLSGAGQVTLWNTTPTNITVTLVSSDTNQATVPPTVTILASQISASFDVTVTDDALLDGTRPVTITAFAPGYGSSAGATMQVFDNETATLQVSLPATVTEGNGTVQGSVQSSAAPVADIPVSLSSTDTTAIQVPASVVIHAGQTSAVFTATIVDDNEIDGTQIAAVIAHVPNWTDGSAYVTVLDNESLNLTVTLPAVAAEDAGTLTGAGSVSIAGTLATNLSVSLTSGNTNKLLPPSSVIIAAGQLSTNFDLTLVDNAIADGHQSVSVTASAPGFTNGSASILVFDDESPSPPSNPRPAHLATNVPANTNLTWDSGPEGELILNGGFETGTFTNWFKQNINLGDFVINDGTLDPPGFEGPTPPFDGNFSVVTAQNGGGTHVLYQDLTLPVGATSATLSWEDRIHNFASQFTTGQTFHVDIRTTNDTLLQVAFTTQPGDPLINDWTNRSFDLTPYIGQTIRIAFVETDSLLYFNLHLDNISIQVNTTGVTNDVYFGTNPAPGIAEFQGTTTNASWPLPLLAPATTYYWKIVAHKTGTIVGPVWQFTTAGVDHFGWSVIPSPQFTNQPFAATITALDAFNSIVTNFTGTVLINSSPSNGVTPSVSANFTNGTWTGNLIVTDRATNITLVAGDANGHTGSSNPFDVVPANMPPIILVQPFDQIAMEDDTATFSVEADGTPLLHYQWHFNDTNNIPDATNSTLIISGVQLTNGGAYSVTVTNAYGSTISSNATLTVPPQLHHFGWSQIPSPRFVHAPFSVTIVARDATNGTFTDFSGIVQLASTNGVLVSPAVSADFTNGLWTGTLTISQVVSNLVLQADDQAGHIGVANPIDIINRPSLGTLKSGTNVVASWPISPSGFVPESSRSLSPAVWTNCPGSPTPSNGLYFQSVPITGTNQFFRLRFTGP